MRTRQKKINWLTAAEFVAVFVIIPTIVFSLVGYSYPGALAICYHVVISLFVFQAAMSYLQSASAFFRKRFPRSTAVEGDTLGPIPKSTFIVCAYLPGEIEVIENTLLNILKNVERPEAGIELILSYNTPHTLHIEQRLKDLAYGYPELVLANAYGSRSKSENLNYALDLASGEIIVLLDADHVVDTDCLKKAWRWLATGEDAVQGRCKVRNGSRNVLTALVEMEFEAMYGISHYAKSLLFHTALFGGSDGYWKTEVLKEFGFRTDVLTEDIDTTLRAILAGKRIIHDRSILSRELAPTDLNTLWFQRKRWGQGWLQCTLRYQWPILKSKCLSLGAKFIWTMLLMWRVVYDMLSHLLFPILFGHWISSWQVELPMNSYIWFALIFTLLSGPFEALAAYKNAVKPRLPFRRFLLYSLLTWPYTFFRSVIHMIAVRDELMGSREWIVSAHQEETAQQRKSPE